MAHAPHPNNCPGCATPDLAFSRHDHAHCCDDTLARAESLLAAKGQRLTPVRRRVLEILLEAHRAMGAYELLERLAAEGFGHQPPVAYRALEFLETHGLAHRVRRLNAFAACMHPGEAHAPAYLICTGCHAVAETAAAPALAALGASASARGFRLTGASIEAEGLCPACDGGAAT